MKALIKYIATEPMATIGFAGFYLFGSIEVVIRLWSNGYPNIAAIFASTIVMFTKVNFNRVVILLRDSKKNGG